ncbi:MAG: nicotinate-nucleotide--dimethylbenzimidazole phosphoribosyltransferase [Burkholderiales bacterium]|nr:nicotinate-nucleotide--dimethylbenzimidazole phosphoribosyltransferase [Burkholderiales bacterium]
MSAYSATFRVPAISSIVQPALQAQLQALIDHKTKPPGSLGQLESLALQIGLVCQSTQPAALQPSAFIFAADHGVMAENVSAFPQSVTWQMVENFLAGGAAINVFARQHACPLQIIDAGVNHVFAARSALLDRKIAMGSKNLACEAAMSALECEQALLAGMALVAESPANVLILGEMGIGNTTVASALMQKITDLPLALCVGAGTGLAPAGVAHKQAVLARALALHAQVSEPLEILAHLGGFEIAMMVGAMLQAASMRKLILIDGFIVTSALLVARLLAPQVQEYCVFAHCSDESGHRAMLDFLGAQPLLTLGLRLGEGSGAMLALPLLQAARNFLVEMASFAAAEVDGALAS